MGATKGDLVAQMLVERDKLLLAVAGLRPEDAERTAIGDWSIKDIVAHIAAWDEESCRRLELIAAGREAEIVDYSDAEVDDWNAQAVAQRRSASWSDTLAELSAARDRLQRALFALPDEHLSAGNARFPVDEWLPTWTCQHDAYHSAEILDWRKRQGV